MSPRLEFAVEAAHRAGRSTLIHFQTGADVEIKADDTPVTIADRNAEQMVRQLLSRSFPGEEILGEEQGGAHDAPDRWVVDPIDGTKSFICGVPLFATLIAYEEAGQPVIGVCYFPALDEMLYAESGGGAFFNGRRCAVSRKRSLKQSVFACGSHRTMAQAGRSAGMERIAEAALATRTWGDAYGHALVATGRVEAMIDPVVKRWDISPLVLIVREAGGACSSFDGAEPLPSSQGDLELISSNGLIHDEVLKQFRL